MLTNFFISMGWSRDDLKWLWLQAVMVAGLVASNVFDIPYWAAYLHVPLSVTGLHWILSVAALVVWIAGKYDSSPLPSKQAMAAGTVPGSPALPTMKIPVWCLMVVAATVLSGCAGNLSRQVEQSNRHMIKLSETMHNAVAPAPSLTDAQFRAVNTDLNAIAIANKAWTVKVASGGDPVQATIDFFTVFKTQIGKLASDAPKIALANLQTDIVAIQSKVAAAVGP